MQRRSFALAVKFTSCVVVGALTLGLGVARGEDLGPTLETVRAATRADRAARISGRLIHETGRSRTAQVRLYPAASTFSADLEQIRARARDSAANYFTVAKQLEHALLSYEEKLLAHDASELMLTAQTQEGLFEFSRVPEGRWMLLAWADTTVPVTPRDQHSKSKSQDRFLQPAPPTTYRQRDFWFISVDVVGGELREVELTDRNRWTSAISR